MEKNHIAEQVFLAVKCLTIHVYTIHEKICLDNIFIKITFVLETTLN